LLLIFTGYILQAQLVEALDKLSWANSKSNKFGLEPLNVSAIVTEGDNIAMTGGFSRTTSSERYTYLHMGSILTVLFNDGKATISMVPRYRVIAGPVYGASYFAVAYKEKMVVFYNDYDKNVDKGVYDKFTNSNDRGSLVLMAAVIEKDGTLKKSVVSDLTKEDFLHQPEKATLSGGLVLMPAVEIKGMLGKPRDEGVMAVITLK
jgi:hypothetical protein